MLEVSLAGSAGTHLFWARSQVSLPLTCVPSYPLPTLFFSFPKLAGISFGYAKAFWWKKNDSSKVHSWKSCFPLITNPEKPSGEALVLSRLLVFIEPWIPLDWSLLQNSLILYISKQINKIFWLVPNKNSYRHIKFSTSPGNSQLSNFNKIVIGYPTQLRYIHEIPCSLTNNKQQGLLLFSRPFDWGLVAKTEISEEKYY